MTETKKKRSIVFVCTANMCRSPMAEYLMRDAVEGRGLGWEVSSAGTSAPDGMPASYQAVLAMADLDIDMNEHRSQPLSREMVDAADLIVVMTADHESRVTWRFPDAADKIRRLRSFVPEVLADDMDVPDPIGLSDFVYRGIRNDMRVAVVNIIEHVEQLN